MATYTIEADAMTSDADVLAIVEAAPLPDEFLLEVRGSDIYFEGTPAQYRSEFPNRVHRALDIHGDLITTPIGRYHGKWGEYKMCAEEKLVSDALERYFRLPVRSRPYYGAGAMGKQAYFEVGVPDNLEVVNAPEFENDSWAGVGYLQWKAEVVEN